MDTENAFDMVVWCFLFTSRKKMFDFARISQTVSKDYTTHLFLQARSTRQGCPLFPLLFSLFIGLPVSSIGKYQGLKQNHVITK